MAAAFSVRTRSYEGPLDLLLTLIQERKLYINEIALAAVTDAYLSYLSEHTEHPMAETAEFVAIAATLLLIKSRSLLPSMQLTEDEEQDISELERRLRLYRIFRSASRALGRRFNAAPLLPSRYRPLEPIRFRPGDATLEALHAAARSLLETLPSAAFRPEVRIAATMSIEEAVEKLQERIRRTARMLFSEIRAGGSKADVIVHFLALLELIKGGIVSAEQQGTFDDIVVVTDTIETPSY
ncbi:MAG TPA: segregation/condensation protein A [Candidatus Paceibacterota bacterium]|nr:segregation/condensation protein A [Candidatus Paceibacterota bacterium]